MILQGMFGTEGELPFWMHSKQRGRVEEGTNFSGLLRGKAGHQLNAASWLEAGGGLLFEEERDRLQLDELYIGIRNSWLQVVLGRKQQEELYNELSAGNRSILWSLNARPLPGLQWSTVQPIFFWPQAGLGFEAGWADYLMEEERYVSNARLHHKRVHLVYRPGKNFQIKAGLQHFVQWAGNSASHGVQPATAKDYIRVLIGHSGGEGATGGDQQNALGNNLGSYEVMMDWKLREYSFNLFWNSIFEDGSGRRLGNTPDGRYGLFAEDTNKKYWVHSLMYEFYYTKHQSHTTTGPHKFDNYFNNGVYRSGWTYEGRVLGVPFITKEGASRITNNRIMVHHFGMEGLAFQQFPFKIINSYRKNYGTNGAGLYPETRNILSSLLELQVLPAPFKLSLQAGSDLSSHEGPQFGGGVKVGVSL